MTARISIQYPEDWNDHEVTKDLVEPIYLTLHLLTRRGETRKGEGGGEMQGKGTAEGFTIIPSPVTSSSKDQEDLEHEMEEDMVYL